MKTKRLEQSYYYYKMGRKDLVLLLIEADEKIAALEAENKELKIKLKS